jgi:hypothetical protein
MNFSEALVFWMRSLDALYGLTFTLQRSRSNLSNPCQASPLPTCQGNESK